MPVLLRSFGLGPRSSNRNSQSSGENRRRVSLLSATNSSSQAAHEKVVQSRIHETASEPEPKKTLKQRLHYAYKQYHVKYLFPLFFIMFYMLLGAFLFYFLESSTAEKVAADEDYKYRRERRLLLLRMEEIVRDESAKRRGYRQKALREAVDNYEKKLNFAVNNESQWTLASAMYYAGTLFTTIGYGDIACSTTAGRIMTVVYSCIGIPLMLITLNDLGKFLYTNINGCVKGLDDFVSYLGVMRICRRTATTSSKADEIITLEAGETATNVEVSSVTSELGSEHNESDIEEELEELTPRMSVKVALGITIGWIFFCSSLFRIWEDWTYGESCYFMFISLSTIGLGDISVKRRDMMVLCFVFVIVGLSLVSMCINVVQVALEEFYVGLMMKLIMEYQEKLAAGGDQMGASVGMMRMWGSNRTAKLLMPLLSKEKKKMAMEKVEEKAKKEGFDVPAILTDLDEKSGMPKLFNIEQHKDGDEPPKILEELVQKQVQIEEAAVVEPVPVIVSHDSDTQTEILLKEEKCHQTESKVFEEMGVQTEDEEKKENQQTHVETQTDSILSNNAEVQTAKAVMVESETTTVATASSESFMQTDYVMTKEQELQTYIAESTDAESNTELETKNARIQTPCPIIEQKSIQTEDLEEYRKSPSKMSSAKKRLRRAFAGKSKATRSSLDHPTMSDWKEVEELTEVEEEAADEGSVESLHWDPVDGMHAEKQLPVKKLKALFDSPSSVDLGRKNPTRKSSSFSKKPGSFRTRKASE